MPEDVLFPSLVVSVSYILSCVPVCTSLVCAVCLSHIPFPSPAPWSKATGISWICYHILTPIQYNQILGWCDVSGTGPIRLERVCEWVSVRVSVKSFFSVSSGVWVFSHMSEPFTSAWTHPLYLLVYLNWKIKETTPCNELDPFFTLSIFTSVKKKEQKLYYIYQVYVVHFYFYFCFFKITVSNMYDGCSSCFREGTGSTL